MNLSNPLREYAKAYTKNMFLVMHKLKRDLIKAGYTKKESKAIAAEIVCEVVNEHIAKNFYGRSAF